jgi:RNA polymerase sigma-70 factor (ECF subfamily)
VRGIVEFNECVLPLSRPETIAIRAFVFMPFAIRSASPNPHAQLGNRELVAECLKGMTIEAWEEFVRRFQPLIASVTARVARDFGDVVPGLVDDLTQDVYLKLCADGFRLLRECRLPHENSIFSYLKFVSASVAHDHFKVLHAHKRRTNLYAGEIQEEEMQSAFQSDKWSSVAEERLLLGKIEEVLEEITEGPNAERDRMVFWLYYRQGLTANAIAAIPSLNLTQKGIESLLSRVTSSLRKQLLRKKKLRQIPSKA